MPARPTPAARPFGGLATRAGILPLLGLALLAGCVAGRETIANPAALEVSFSWSAGEGCTARSPAIRVAGLPAATARLALAMTDLDAPAFAHGGGELPVPPGGEVPPGALGAYTGPCPPGRTHQYRFTVEAIDAQNRIIARGTATRPYPPP